MLEQVVEGGRGPLLREVHDVGLARKGQGGVDGDAARFLRGAHLERDPRHDAVGPLGKRREHDERRVGIGVEEAAEDTAYLVLDARHLLLEQVAVARDADHERDPAPGPLGTGVGRVRDHGFCSLRDAATGAGAYPRREVGSVRARRRSQRL